MATSFDVICNRALSVIDDYKLRKLYDANIELFHDKIDGWIISSAAKFRDSDSCRILGNLLVARRDGRSNTDCAET